MRNPDEPEPRPKTYGFKPKEFERLNVARFSDSPPPSTQDLAVLAGQPARKPASSATPGPAASTGLPPAAPARDPNDVYSIRRELRAREQVEGGDNVRIRKVRSRRKRDYWLLMIVANLFFGTVAIHGWGNPMLMIYGLAGIIVLSLGLTWVMWFVMSDY